MKIKSETKKISFLLVILEKYEPIIFRTYHNFLLAGHQGPYRTAMTIRQRFFIHNLMNKVKIHQSMSYLFKDKTKIQKELTHLWKSTNRLCPDARSFH